MKLKKLIAASLVVVMTAGLMLTGCGKKENENEKDSDTVTIKWIAQGPGDDGWEGSTKEILEKFEEQTGIHVEAEFYGFSDLFEVIETKAASGSSDFDIMSVDVTYVSKYAENGYLDSLDEYFTDEEKAKWDEASYQAGVWKDKMYAAPENTSSQLLYYNKTMLEKAGITIPENDAENRLTYEEVAEMAKQVQDKLDPDGNKGIIGLDFQQVSRVYQMNMLPNSMGGKNISDDGFSLDGVVNTKPWIDAMTWYQGLVNDGIASRGYDADQLGEQFYSGKMAFIVGGTWTSNPGQMKVDDEIGCTYAPCFEGYEDQVATSTGSWYFGLNSKSENKEAAAEFIKFFTLGEGSDMWLDINGDIPSRLDKQEEIANNAEAAKEHKIGAYEAANTAFPRAVTPAFGEYSTIMDQAWEDVRNGADVKETLDNAVAQFKTATAVYKK